MNERRFLLPIKHEITIEKIRGYSPILADRFMLSTSQGLDEIVKHVLAVMGGDEFRRRVEGKVVTQLSYAHRYYNPPEKIPELGYKLRTGSFDELVHQLRPREVLIAYGSPYGTHDSAAHITCDERMIELETDWNFAPDYYAVDVRKLLGGFNEPLPKNEINELLGYSQSQDNS